MKKIAFVFIALFLITLKTNAQIPNAGFESWTNGSPDGWLTPNVANLLTPITRISQSHSGNFALRGEPALLMGNIVGATISSGIGGTGFPINYRPESITGYYKFSPAPSSGDRFSVLVLLTKGGLSGTPIASNAIAFSQQTDVYTQFSIPFIYVLNDIPTTCVIQFSLVGPSITTPIPAVGSFYIIDDLALAGTTDLKSEQSNSTSEYKIFQNYPNPFNPKTKINFELPIASHVFLKVYDSIGQEIMVLIDKELSKGYHEVSFDGTALPSGIYLYRIQTGEFIASKKMMLVK
jgi:hypothetical protein